VRDITDATAAKDAVELVFTLVSITGGAAFSQAMKLSSVVPASGFLTKVSSHRPLIPELRAGHL
jgi:hypothetical protein